MHVVMAVYRNLKPEKLLLPQNVQVALSILGDNSGHICGDLETGVGQVGAEIGEYSSTIGLTEYI